MISTETPPREGRQAPVQGRAARLPFGLNGWKLVLLLVIFAGGLGQRVTEHVKAGGMNPRLLPSDTGEFISMAQNLRYGLGWIDPRQVRAFAAHPWRYRSGPPSDRAHLTWFTWNDPGLSVFYWLAGAIFHHAASPPILLLWMQIVVGSLNVFVMYWLGWRVGGSAFGLVAAAFYAGFWPMATLCATHPYYYFWAAELSAWNLVGLFLVMDRAAPELPLGRRLLLGAGYGLFLGLATLVRPTFALLGLAAFFAILIRWRRALRSMLPVAVLVLLVSTAVLTPLALRSYQVYGKLRPPRPFWHAQYVAIGAYPNPYGIQFSDNAGFAFARSKGLKPGDPHWAEKYDAIMRAEVQRIRRQSPWLWPCDVAKNLYGGFTMGWSDNQLRWTLARREIRASLPRDRAVVGLLLLFAAICGFVFRRDDEAGWLWAAVLAQGIYFVGTTSLLIPPYFNYDTAYLPEFVLLLTAAAACMVRVVSASSQSILPRVHPGQPGEALDSLTSPTRFPFPSWVFFVSGAAAALLCWQRTPDNWYYDTWNRLASVLTAPVDAILLYDLVARWLDDRSGRLVFRVYCSLAAASLLLYGCLHGRIWNDLTTPTAFPAILLGALAIYLLTWESRAATAASVLILTIGTRFHPEYGLLPLAVTTLLRPGWVAVSGVLERSRRACFWMVAIGALAWSVSGISGLELDVRSVVFAAPLAYLILTTLLPFGSVVFAVLRGVLALVLVVSRFHLFDAWSALGYLLVLVWIEHVARTGRAESRLR